MFDFLRITTNALRNGVIEIRPDFDNISSSDLMIRGGRFYAIWDERRGFWSTSEQDAVILIDNELVKFKDEYVKRTEAPVKVQYMRHAESGSIDRWHKYIENQMWDNFRALDSKILFSNSDVKKEDYATKTLPYPLEKGEYPSFERLISTLYTDTERHKLEWAIGAIVSGESTHLQKFMVLYGAQGSGKSTILNIVEQLFHGYCTVFDAKALGSSSQQFALEAFSSNPLVAIQHDGNLSKIEDNTRLNSLVSHEKMLVNEKYTKGYTSSFNSFLFIGSNSPVKITDSKSGLLRRLIDVSPSGNKVPGSEYKRLVKNVEFELPAIAWHCREVYLDDPDYFDDYVPMRMLGSTNAFFNFMVDSYPVFKREDGTTAKQAWSMYKQYVEDSKTPYPYSFMTFREELRSYFRECNDTFDDNGIKAEYHGFKLEKFEDFFSGKKKKQEAPKPKSWIELKEQHSVFDDECAECYAQYAGDGDKPTRKWDSVRTSLLNIDTSKVHYVKVPENHIVIDFDLTDDDGNKSLEKNIKEASKFPETYCEVSKSGNGLHLHYIYSGDVSKLSRVYKDHIEVKVFSGLSSLRRKLTLCNNIQIATISSGLPLKGEKAMVEVDCIRDEKRLRKMIQKNLNKEIHMDTSSSVNFIFKLLEDAYNSGMAYDVTDMKNSILGFAANSTNQAENCLRVVSKMKFKSEERAESFDGEAPIVFFDVEVFPNLFLVNWKVQGDGNPVHRMINPTPREIEELFKYRLVGFNNRRYDNHMLYACYLGYTNEQIYKLSQSIITEGTGFFGEAYNLSFTDVYDFSAKKQSLKKFEIELSIHHQELGLPWDKPVPEDMWGKVAEYCDNDLIATEAVFNSRYGDFVARQILAEIAGGTANDTTNALTTKFIFGNDKHPRLVYTDLATGEQS